MVELQFAEEVGLDHQAGPQLSEVAELEKHLPQGGLLRLLSSAWVVPTIPPEELMDKHSVLSA